MKQRKVVIVGGGTAGWMTAAFLCKTFGTSLRISLVESPAISTIGVGEATFSDIHLFFEVLGLREEDWMAECNASYKVAIRFVNWNAERRTFYHPFQRFEIVQGRRIIDWWLTLKRDTAPFDYSCYTVPAICDAQRSPCYMDGRPFDSNMQGKMGPSLSGNKAILMEDLSLQYPYAYHFDANLLAKFLCRYATARGITHIQDDVVDVQLGENGDIVNVRTAEHGKCEGDLFVDCTGFRGLLINKALKEPFISFSDSLPCDSAIAMQVPHDPEGEGINPFTTATALSSGWVWNIPLFHRMGTGYVYASAFTDREAAEAEFRRHLGKRADGCTAQHIKMRVGRNRNSWVKNCVAIGLSGGFVEPLESTGIFFIHHVIEQLVAYFPKETPNVAEIRQFNKSVADCMDGVREFLTIHYVAGSRADTPFWKATKNDLIVPDGLAERLQLWEYRLPTSRTIRQEFHGFPPYSYCVMLLGLGHRPKKALEGYDEGAAKALAAFDEIQRRTEYLKATLPSLYEYLSAKYDKSSKSKAAASCEIA
jgi:tryptophan 6-halogenase